MLTFLALSNFDFLDIEPESEVVEYWRRLNWPEIQVASVQFEWKNNTNHWLR